MDVPYEMVVKPNYELVAVEVVLYYDLVLIFQVLLVLLVVDVLAENVAQDFVLDLVDNVGVFHDGSGHKLVIEFSGVLQDAVLEGVVSVVVDPPFVDVYRRSAVV